MNIETDMDLFLWACKGDHDAAHVLKILTDAADTWDNVEDQDVPATQVELSRTFTNLMVRLPANPFYQRHRSAIEAIIGIAHANWRAANKIERDYEHGITDKLHVAYIIRSSYFDLVTYCAHVIGGPDWAEEVALKARSMNQHETFPAFVNSLDAEIAARRAGKGE